MDGRYEYPVILWLMFGAAAVAAVLAIYAWHRRAAPAARALTVLAAVGAPWALAAAMERMATEPSTSLFWFTFHSLWHLPAGAVGLWFALEYAGLRQSVPPRTVTLMGLPVLVLFLLLLTSDAHHFVWETFSPTRGGRIVPTPLGATAVAFSLLVSVATVLVYLWLFVQSPRHRPGAGLCLAGQILLRAAYAVETMAASPASHLDLTILVFPLTVAMNAVALFRFHEFQLIPVARGRIVDQMGEGMLVLNSAQQILDINLAGERMLRLARSLAVGKRLGDVLPQYPCCTAAALEEDECEVPFTDAAGNLTRNYTVRRSPLVHGQSSIGTLLLVSDVTRERQAQAEVVEHQRAVAALQERDHLARELHDGLGQVLAYAKMQAETARELLQQRRFAEADAALRDLAINAHDAQHDVRDFILGARTGVLATSHVLDALQQYIERYNRVHHMSATLEVEPALRSESLDTLAAAQVLRIVQEALTNVRKHARARVVRVQLRMTGGACATAVVADDGVGFDAQRRDDPDALRFGLPFMQERAKEIGASLAIRSRPGEGTAVVLTVPLRKDCHACAAG